MKIVKRALLRAALPAFAVVAVLALSFRVPLPMDASNAGYGYNCGVKGNGYHDHGKLCPNRPFPGKGKGILKFAVIGLSITREDTATTAVNAKTKSTSRDVANTNTSATDDEDTSLASRKGHSKGHGRGNGHIGF